MTRMNFDRQLRTIQLDVLDLGGVVAEATRAAIGALLQRDHEAARRVIEGDQDINDRRFAIENALIVLMSTQSPMARDLRLMAALLEVTTELERMGDYAKGIARVALRLIHDPAPPAAADLRTMAELAVGMLLRSLQALMAQDTEEARRLPQEDDQVDQMYNQVYRCLVGAMIADAQAIDQASHLLWVAHNLERMADRVTNICERTVFIATGELIELDASV